MPAQMPDSFICHPIGFFHSPQSEKYMAARQPELAQELFGSVVLNGGSNFEQALEDLAGFERIWLIYWFHRNQTWKPKVLTPRGGDKRGVFATRSPHRPNPLGLSCVKLIEIKGRELIIGKSDLLDGTPILDIKPYLCYADAFPNSAEGWTQSEVPGRNYELQWSELAAKQAGYIALHSKLDLFNAAALRLCENPFPFPGHRIKKLGDDTYELSVKTWRVYYFIEGNLLVVNKITSGYDQATLLGQKASRWDDAALHRSFIDEFPCKQDLLL